MAEDIQSGQEDIPVSDALDRVLSAPTAARGSRTDRIRAYGAVVIFYGTAELVALFWKSLQRFGLTDTQGVWISIGCGISGSRYFSSRRGSAHYPSEDMQRVRR
ncbi:hypothetical protein JCM33774_88460 [Actinophytocola sp. KF-1]